MKKSFFRLYLLGISLSASYAAKASVVNPDALLLPSFFGQDTPTQRPHNDGQRPGGPANDQMKDFNLTDKQKAKVEAIMKKQRQEMDALHKGNGGNTNREAMSTARHRLDADTDAKFKQVLTAEQYTKYQARKQDKPQPPKDGHNPQPRRTDN